MGEAIGPQIQFNYNKVDMKNVFVSDKGSYEVRLVTLLFFLTWAVSEFIQLLERKTFSEF